MSNVKQSALLIKIIKQNLYKINSKPTLTKCNQSRSINYLFLNQKFLNQTYILTPKDQCQMCVAFTRQNANEVYHETGYGTLDNVEGYELIII